MTPPRPKIFAASWRTSADYQILRDSLHARRLPITFVNGCFDLLHSGHVRLLNFAARESVRLSLGRNDGALVVGLNSNSSVARIKGPGRPVLSLAERMQMLLALEVVDAVVGFDEDTATELVRDLRPCVYVKGADYAGKDVPEVAALPDPSVVLYCPRGAITLTDMSSTKIITKVNESERTRVATEPKLYSPLQAAAAELARAGDPADRPGGGGQQGG